MQKVRVFQLAKELKVQSALILELLDRLGSDITSDLSVVDGETADVVRKKITVAMAAETKRLIKTRVNETAPPASAEETVATANTPPFRENMAMSPTSTRSHFFRLTSFLPGLTPHTGIALLE